MSTVSRPISYRRRSESFVVCHSTFDNNSAICRGFYESYSTNILRIYDRLGGYDEVDPPAKETGGV